MTDENSRKNKRVESCLVLCLDGGSSPPSSTTYTGTEFPVQVLRQGFRIHARHTEKKKAGERTILSLPEKKILELNVCVLNDNANFVNILGKTYKTSLKKYQNFLFLYTFT